MTGSIEAGGGVEVAEQVAGVMADRAGKYLTFKLADEEYGLEILKVREIIGLMEITKVPRTPHFVRGVINLRGKVIPVVDLRAKFGLEHAEDTEETCIIVVEVEKEGSAVQMGILVDTVSEVLDINAEDIEDTPSFGTDVDTGFILGMAKAKGSVKILLNIQAVLTAVEMVSIAQASAAAEELSEAEELSVAQASAAAEELSEA